MNKASIMLFYGILVIVLGFFGYNFMNKVVEVSSEIGAFIGALVGLIISVALWYTVGKKLVSN